MSAEFSIIGKPTAMVDAAEKTTGRANTQMTSACPACSWERFCILPTRTRASGTLIQSRAEQLEGVVAVADWAGCAENLRDPSSWA